MANQAASSSTTSVSRTIKAPPEQLWEMVSDVTRMGSWSPETTSCSWLKGASGPATGARFKGDNQNGSKSWSIQCEVTDCEPGKRFAFDAMAGPIRYANWSYDFEATDDGTLVTESVVDNRGAIFKWVGAKLSGVSDRQAHNQRTMEETLAALAAAAEA